MGYLIRRSIVKAILRAANDKRWGWTKENNADSATRGVVVVRAKASALTLTKLVDFTRAVFTAQGHTPVLLSGGKAGGLVWATFTCEAMREQGKLGRQGFRGNGDPRGGVPALFAAEEEVFQATVAGHPAEVRGEVVVPWVAPVDAPAEAPAASAEAPSAQA